MKAVRSSDGIVGGNILSKNLLTANAPDSLLSKMHEVNQMEQPRPDQLRFLRKWQLGTKEGNAFLRGAEVNTWAKEYEDDFIVFDKPGDMSKFEKWLSPTLLQWYERTWGLPLRSVSGTRPNSTQD